MDPEKQPAFDRHTDEAFRCTDPGCMFPAQPWTWCTRDRDGGRRMA